MGTLKFFVAPKHPCSYLPREDASTLFVDPNQIPTQTSYTALSQLGFRRSGNFIYRPHCEHCSACIPVRIPVKSFVPSKKQRRVLNKNQDIQVQIEPAEYQDAQYALYERYIKLKHADGDMFPPSQRQYAQFIISEWSQTQFMSLTLEGKLVGIGVIDQLNDGLSAVYNFYEPELNKRSLGVFTVLKQIELAQDRALEHLYIGYWVKACQKMRYKDEYRPFEMLVNHQWVRSE